MQRQTFRFLLGRRASGERSGARPAAKPARHSSDDLVATGGSGFGVMALIVAVERGWVTRAAAAGAPGTHAGSAGRATCYHGVFPHFMNGRTGATIPFMRKDDGGDLVETSFLMMGLLCAREYFKGDTPAEAKLRGLVNYLWGDVEWDWYTRDRTVLNWHWSPNNGWAVNMEIRGWNECLDHLCARRLRAALSHRPRRLSSRLCRRPQFPQRQILLRHLSAARVPFGGPLFFAHYSFCGIDPQRSQGSLCRLLGTESSSCAHQSRPLRRTIR